MGKQELNAYKTHAPHCKDQDAPICGNESCRRSGFPDEKLHLRVELSSSTLPENAMNNDKASDSEDASPNLEERNREPIKELIIVGAGPHALTLFLRLLEPDPDFLSEKVRHLQAESSKQMRPIREVYRHIKDMARGPAATLQSKKKKKSRRARDKKQSRESQVPPPLTLQTVLDSVQVIDAHGGWLASWKQNFEAIGIVQLRSLMNAHADPFDHRSLEFYAEAHGRDEELVTLQELTQRDHRFRGPYQVPTTHLFHDFHEALVQSYGIKDVVRKGKVLSITPMKDPESDENIFQVQICNGSAKGITTITARRCVCALGPSFSKFEFSWEKVLRYEQEENYAQVSKRILRSDEIVQWLQRYNLDKQVSESGGDRLLVVGGGITSVQLVLCALKKSFYKSVVFIQRSQTVLRHFDVENEWMGPKRGKMLEGFFSKDMEGRSKLLNEARKGGSMPPELLEELKRQGDKNPSLSCREKIEICRVAWTDNEFHVTFDDCSTTKVNSIWLATGCENIIDRYPVLENLREALPMDVVNGLPTLSEDLSWASTSEDADECKWKCCARKRLYCMGSVAGLQLGADALNIVGARHGAVKIAKSIRDDMHISNP